MDFFKEGGSGMAMRYFLAGYRLEAKQDGFAGGTVLWWEPFPVNGKG